MLVFKYLKEFLIGNMLYLASHFCCLWFLTQDVRVLSHHVRDVWKAIKLAVWILAMVWLYRRP